MADLEPMSASSELSPEPDPESSAGRWELIRDLAVFQVKVLLDASRDVALVPVSLVAGFIDLIGGGERPRRLFYDVLALGRRSEDWINLFGEADRLDAGRERALLDPNAPSVDAVVARIEALLVEQYERGGMTAATKHAIDRSIDAFHTKRTDDEGR